MLLLLTGISRLYLKCSLLNNFNSEVKPKCEFFHLSIHVGDSIAEMRPISKQYQDKTEFLHLTETSLTQPVYLLSPVDGTFWGKLNLSHAPKVRNQS